MSGLSPEEKALLTRDNELKRLEQERRQKPRKGTLAAEVSQEKKAAEKAMRVAETRLNRARKAESILRTAPNITRKDLIALVRKGK